MKTTLRFSVSGETDGALRNKLAGALTARGIELKPTETATYESSTIPAADLSGALKDFWTEAANHPGPGSIDHVWLYCGQ